MGVLLVCYFAHHNFSCVTGSLTRTSCLVVVCGVVLCVCVCVCVYVCVYVCVCVFIGVIMWCHVLIDFYHHRFAFILKWFVVMATIKANVLWCVESAITSLLVYKQFLILTFRKCTCRYLHDFCIFLVVYCIGLIITFRHQTFVSQFFDAHVPKCIS